MRLHHFLLPLLLAWIAFPLYPHTCEGVYDPDKSYQNQLYTQKPPPPLPPDKPPQEDPCAHLPEKQQAFARELSALHKTNFCSHFSPSQREEAMKLANSPITTLSGESVDITPDEAIEILMKNSRQIKP